MLPSDENPLLFGWCKSSLASNGRNFGSNIRRENDHNPLRGWAASHRCRHDGSKEFAVKYLNQFLFERQIIFVLVSSFLQYRRVSKRNSRYYSLIKYI